MSHRLSVDTRPFRAMLSAWVFTGMAFAAGESLAQRARDCAVTRQQGQAEIVREGQTWRSEPGIRLQAKDRVSTAAGAKLEISCSDGIVLIVGERSALNLDQFASRDAGDMLLGLIEGIVRFALPERRPPGRFEVTTPTTVASVRSTDWLAEVTPKGTAVFVVRGRVAVQGRAGGSPVDLLPGDGVDVSTGAVAPPPVKWGAPRVARALAAVTF